MDQGPDIAKVALVYVAVLLVIFWAVAVWNPAPGDTGDRLFFNE